MANNGVRLPFIGRVIYPFQSRSDEELSLQAGDLVLITRIEDRLWYYGQSGPTDRGLLPRNNVTAITNLPSVSNGQPYFATLAAFQPQQDGDLAFRAGEILVGLNRVDDNWWYGRSGDGRQGIFPTSLAWQVDLRPIQVKSTRRRARVLQHLVAQLPEELDLKKGEEVIVTGEAEDVGWLRGEYNGKSGIFPSGFVSFISEENPPVDHSPLLVEISPPAFNSTTTTTTHYDMMSNVRPYGTVSYDFQGQQADELSLYAGQTVYLIRHVNAEWIEGETDGGLRGIFPTAFVEIVVDCPKSDLNRDIDWLLDFDPLLISQGSHSTVKSSGYTTPTSGTVANSFGERDYRKESTTTTTKWEVCDAQTNLDSLIARNLNLLDLTSSERTCQKQRPSSTWSQSLTKLQIEPTTTPHAATIKSHSMPLPAIPPRKQETQPAVTLPVERMELEREPNAQVAQVDSCGSISSTITSSDSGASRKSYTRPAPPPPPNESPNLGLSRQDSSDSVAHHPLRPAPFIPVESDEDRVEGRRQRAEKARQRKMEEDQLRDLEMRKKIKEQREKVLTELLVTEREYCRDLRLTCQVFQLHDPHHLEAKGIDVSTLFGNILEVIKLSEVFIDLLNRCSRTDDELDSDEYTIGKSFIQTEPEFRRVYGQYCINHDDAQFLLEKYESVPSVNRILDEGVASLRNQIVCFNMGSVIIKPVQRIMKYPLILGELIKHTENDNRDKSNLILASGLMTAVATYINESKRKKEIVLKYRDSGLEEKLSQKISRFSMHSVAKKSSRFGMLLKTSLGIAPSTRDVAFEEVEVRFSELFRVVQTALRDITTVCEQLKATSHTQYTIAEAIASFYGETSRIPLIDNFRTAQRMIYTQHWNAFDTYVIQHVRNPLTALCDACIGPERLAIKRRDKLLDSNIARERLAKNRDPIMRRTLEEEENIARNTYAALNSQLMEELPIITEHGYNIYRRCISSFLYARKLMVGRITKALLDLNEIPDIANLQGEIDEDFNVAYNKAAERLCRVTFINKSFRRTSTVVSTDASASPNDTTPTRKLTSGGLGGHSPGEGLVVQSREAIDMLRSKYQPDQLYRVTGRCDIKESLDLAANSGLIVAVIKREDPMGNTARWFCNAGEVRGFLPARHLHPLLQPGSTQLLRPESSASVASSGASGGSGNSVSSESFRDLNLLDQEISIPAPPTHNENIYDLPPSYEEAVESDAQSPHRYCEIDDIVKGSDDSTEMAYASPEKAESPIYAFIEDVIPPTETKLAPSNENNVYKVEYTFSKRTNLEIDLTEGELVTVLSKKDEAGNTEWWLVENDAGLQGYAPAAYLTQLVTDCVTPQLFG